MPTTPRLLLPYPSPDDNPDGPAQFKALAERVDTVVPAGVPVGAITMWALATAPDGWLLCNGAAVPGTYPKLQALMANTPNLQARVPVGAGSGRALAATGGEATHTLTTAEMPAHNHSVFGGRLIIFSGAGAQLTPNAGGPVSNSGGASIDNMGGGGAHENMPPFLVVNFIICAA